MRVHEWATMSWGGGGVGYLFLVMTNRNLLIGRVSDVTWSIKRVDQRGSKTWMGENLEENRVNPRGAERRCMPSVV